MHKTLRLGFIVLVLVLAFAAPMAHLDAVHSQVLNQSRGQGSTPQDVVVCTGWHALCSDSPDCQVNGDKADCACARVDETHIVATSEIQDPTAKRRTLARCTQEHPCDVDEAPVCRIIQSGRYEVDHARYDWVSTYSYRGWCAILQKGFVACDPQAPGYAGDRQWAICDAAPCMENPSPADPDKPLTCQCRVRQDPFVGLRGCTGANGGIMSSFPVWAWDFEKNTYPFDMPGYEFVRGACSAMQSDPVVQPQREGTSR